MITHFYNSDVFFKLAFGQNNEESYLLRRFLIEGIVGKDIHLQYTCVNPEISSQVINNKKAILDIYMNIGELEVNVEMQKSKLSPFINRRFMHYACKLINYQLKPGQTYGSLKNLIQIILIEDIDKRNPCLMDKYCSRNLLSNEQLGCILTTIYVYLPYINNIVKDKVLDEWEAMIYLLHNGHLKHVLYNKGEMIEMLEKKYEEFSQDESLVKETSLRYQAEVDFNEWHDYDVKIAKDEGRKEGINVGRHEGRKEGINVGRHEGRNEGKVMVLLYLIKEKYNQNAQWLSTCTLEELDQVMNLLAHNASYEQIQKKLS